MKTIQSVIITINTFNVYFFFVYFTNKIFVFICSALHYNNCMFISHHLMTLGHQFIKKLPSNINATLVDLVPKIRRLGTGCFLQQQAKQKELMSEYMSGANGKQISH